ncbi:hypothetical protein CY34DRAFT_577498 [Suillus luteus UH-Slu-Lm8-n1]|uniref:Uncharacterized protein n=1 Tax=Suillus luteus UH-Slu-Lm8-n1 TaxID=930992 RepID=A0A0D0AEH0_9AGAM|nr:hypothetical protein CY34DRAFT_577498 [Suillus luteus UH-Slu-Lm8-n1]
MNELRLKSTRRNFKASITRDNYNWLTTNQKHSLTYTAMIEVPPGVMKKAQSISTGVQIKL